MNESETPLTDRIAQWFRNMLRRCHHRRLHNGIWKSAESIMALGQDNESEVQQYLNHAKDSLYSASSALEREFHRED